MSLLVHTASFKGREALVLACDNGVLDWLSDRFTVLSAPGPSSRRGFVIGNGKPIRSEQGVEIRFKAIEDPAPTLIVQQDGHFVWYISREVAARFQDLVRGLAMSHRPGHQYLEADDPQSPMLVLTKGEYDEDTLRSMSKDMPANSLEMTR